jgi:hypothetical protein
MKLLPEFPLLRIRSFQGMTEGELENQQQINQRIPGVTRAQSLPTEERLSQQLVRPATEELRSFLTAVQDMLLPDESLVNVSPRSQPSSEPVVLSFKVSSRGRPPPVPNVFDEINLMALGSACETLLRMCMEKEWYVLDSSASFYRNAQDTKWLLRLELTVSSHKQQLVDSLQMWDSANTVLQEVTSLLEHQDQVLLCCRADAKGALIWIKKLVPHHSTSLMLICGEWIVSAK